MFIFLVNALHPACRRFIATTSNKLVGAHDSHGRVCTRPQHIIRRQHADMWAVLKETSGRRMTAVAQFHCSDTSKNVGGIGVAHAVGREGTHQPNPNVATTPAWSAGAWNDCVGQPPHRTPCPPFSPGTPTNGNTRGVALR